MRGDHPFVDWGWIGDHIDEIQAATLEHLRLTLIAVCVGFLIASALALLGLRWRWLLGPITWTTGVLYTIPSLALFAFLVPITGLTTLTAEIGLVGYTLLILVRNIVAGVDGVPAAVREAADGMGLTPRHRTFAVDLRLATPAIIAGLRVATVTTVGLVTVTALIGLGGLGSLIALGLQRPRIPTPIVVGGVLSVVMAVVLDALLVLMERTLTPWAHAGRRRRLPRAVGTFEPVPVR